MNGKQTLFARHPALTVVACAPSLCTDGQCFMCWDWEHMVQRFKEVSVNTANKYVV